MPQIKLKDAYKRGLKDGKLYSRAALLYGEADCKTLYWAINRYHSATTNATLWQNVFNVGIC